MSSFTGDIFRKKKQGAHIRRNDCHGCPNGAFPRDRRHRRGRNLVRCPSLSALLERGRGGEVVEMHSLSIHYSGKTVALGFRGGTERKEVGDERAPLLIINCKINSCCMEWGPSFPTTPTAHFN